MSAKTDIRDVVRKKVALAIKEKAEWGSFAMSSGVSLHLADAAISATLQALIELELPEEALIAADDTPAFSHDKTFRAILLSLQSTMEGK